MKLGITSLLDQIIAYIYSYKFGYLRIILLICTSVEQIAEAGLEALKNWMLEIGLPLTISEIGATADMIPGITEGTICYPAGYMDLKPEDITEILRESM